MAESSPLSLVTAPFTGLWSQMERLRDRAQTLLRVTTTRAPIAQTPKQLIWTLNKAKLYRYTPVVPEEQRQPVPLLLVFALMNRSSILDLRPGNSFVEYMLRQGYDVYLLDWGVPGLEDKNTSFDDYVLEYLPRAIRKLKAVSGSSSFSLLGWCIGAILTTLYASLRPDQGLKNLLLLTAPLDFSNRDAITFARFTDKRFFDPDKILASYGNMPAELIDYGARVLKPVENFVSNYVRLMDNLDNPKVVEAWHAMNTWVNDNIPLAGAAYRQLIKDFYHENNLIKGTLVIRGEKVDLARLRANLLVVIAEDDHITPPCQSETVVDKVGSKDKQVIRVPGGHIGIMAGSGAVKSTWPKIETWLRERSGKPSR
jgi:polyhydroxyalkanoate synthase